MDTPPSASIHEERLSRGGAVHGLFNNLVIFDQNVARTASIRLCLISPRAGRGTATASNSLQASAGRAMARRQAFTGGGRRCTFDLLLSSDKLRRNPHAAW